MRGVIRGLAATFTIMHFVGFMATSLFTLDSMRENADLMFAITAPLWAIVYLLASESKTAERDT